MGPRGRMMPCGREPRGPSDVHGRARGTVGVFVGLAGARREGSSGPWEAREPSEAMGAPRLFGVLGKTGRPRGHSGLQGNPEGTTAPLGHGGLGVGDGGGGDTKAMRRRWERRLEGKAEEEKEPEKEVVGKQAGGEVR